MAIIATHSIYHHDIFDKYLEDHIYALPNISDIFLYLSKKSYTIPQLSSIINTEERIINNRTQFDINLLMIKLKRFGYVEREKDSQKYETGYYYWNLTDKGKDLLKSMSLYLLFTIKLNTIKYEAYKQAGLT